MSYLKIPSVTVITSSIGRPALRQCIESVKNQQYPGKIKHLVIVNGPKWHDQAREVLKDYPDVHAHYWMEETGDCGVGPGAGEVFAAGPWLTTSDLVFFLNDDDFYDPDHVVSVAKIVWENNLDWGFSLRKFVNPEGKPFCNDDFDSLGFWPCVYSETQWLVDNSCYAMTRKTAKEFGMHWVTPGVGDRAILSALKASQKRAGCTGKYTVNYRVGGSAPPADSDYYKINTLAITELYPKDKFPEGFPWTKPTVFVPEAGK